MSKFPFFWNATEVVSDLLRKRKKEQEIQRNSKNFKVSNIEKKFVNTCSIEAKKLSPKS